MNAIDPKTRTEELKELALDNKLGDEINLLCTMVNPTCSASLVQDITSALEKRIRWLVELKLIDPRIRVLDKDF